MRCRRYFLVVLFALIASGCGATVEKKPPTEEEIAQRKARIDSATANIVEPILGVALSACQHQKKFGRWPKVDFSPTAASKFESFEILPSESNFKSKFTLKASNYGFNLVVGLPTSDLKADAPEIYLKNKPYKENTIEEKIAKKHLEILSKMEEKSVKDYKKKQKAKDWNKQINSEDLNCKLVLNGSVYKRAYSSFTVELPIVIGKTWVTKEERTFLAKGYLFLSGNLNPPRQQRESNAIDFIFESGIAEILIMGALCTVLDIDSDQCFRHSYR